MGKIEERKSLFSSIIIGFIAGATEAVITNPLVTIKSCLQGGVTIPWKSWIQNNKNTIIKIKDGVSNAIRFLYRGTGARVIGIGFSVGIRILVHDAIVKYIFASKKLTLGHEAGISMASGVASGFFITPMELGMTLQQTTTPSQKANSLIRTLRNVQERWGIKKALTGFSCICARDGIVASGYLTLTPMFSEYISKKYEINHSTATLVGGIAIGTGLAALTHPLDTVKTIQQKNLRDTSHQGSHTITYAANQIFNEHGVRGFYKGVFFRTMRIGPHVGIVTLISEVLSDGLVKYHSKGFLKN